MKDKLKKNLFYIIGGGICAIGVLFTILLICMSCRKVTLGKNYTYKFGDLGDTYTIEVTAKFDDENYITYDAFMGSESDTITTRYKISSDRNLFIKYDNDDWKQFGKVNAYQIELNNNATSEYGLNMKLILECKSAKTARVVYIVILSISFAVGISCIIAQTVINKKSKIAQTAETLD